MKIERDTWKKQYQELKKKCNNKDNMTPKDVMMDLLDTLAKMMKARCEQSYDENESDKWSKNHDEIVKIFNQIKNGGIK